MPGPEKFKCYIAFDKNLIFDDNEKGDYLNKENYGGVYDYFRNAKILRSNSGFSL